MVVSLASSKSFRRAYQRNLESFVCVQPPKYLDFRIQLLMTKWKDSLESAVLQVK